MIKKFDLANELMLGMQRELQPQIYKKAMVSLDQAGNCLHSALEILDQEGFNVQAAMIMDILTKIASGHKRPKDPTKVPDRHTQGLTSKKMIENLKNHGTVFNMADDADDLLNAEVMEPSLEVSEDEIVSKDFEDEI